MNFKILNKEQEEKIVKLRTLSGIEFISVR